MVYAYNPIALPADARCIALPHPLEREIETKHDCMTTMEAIRQ